MLIPRLSFGKLVHISSSLMTLLLAMNMHALAGHLKDGPSDAGDPAVSDAAAPATKPKVAGNAGTRGLAAARNDAEGWTSVLPAGDQNASAPEKAPDPVQTVAASNDCASGSSCVATVAPGINSGGDGNRQVDRAETDLARDILARRSDIDGEQKGLEDQKRILDAAKAALDEKMRDLDNSMAALAERQAAHKETMAAETERLVKIYEEMPPKEAAAIFNIMDIHVLVSLASKMSPRKISAVMGYMVPERVNLVSQYMAGVRNFRPLRTSFGADGKSEQTADAGSAAWWSRGNASSKADGAGTLALSRQ